MIRMFFYVLFFCLVSVSAYTKELKIVSSAEVGGGYDLYSRLLSRHIGKYLPENSNVVVQNMPGAGGITATNYLYNIAPRDGTVIGGVHRAMMHADLMKLQNVSFKFSDFKFIGSIAGENEVCAIWNKHGVITIKDLKSKEFLVGGSGANNTQQYPAILNTVLKTKLKIITGYKSTREIVLAMERGEVDGICGIPWSTLKREKNDWIQDNRISVIVQFSTKKHEELQNIPLISNLVNNERDKQLLEFIFSRETIGRPYIAPPFTPTDRVNSLILAFNNTMKDPDFLKDAQTRQIEISPIDSIEMKNIISNFYLTPKDVIEYASEIIKN